MTATSRLPRRSSVQAATSPAPARGVAARKRPFARRVPARLPRLSRGTHQAARLRWCARQSSSAQPRRAGRPRLSALLRISTHLAARWVPGKTTERGECLRHLDPRSYGSLRPISPEQITFPKTFFRDRSKSPSTLLVDSAQITLNRSIIACSLPALHALSSLYSNRSTNAHFAPNFP